MNVAKHHYLRGMALSTVATLVGMAASLATIMMAARMVTKAELGAFFLIMIVVQFATALGDLGMRNAAITILSREDCSNLNRTSQYLQTINLISSLVAAVTVAALLPYLKRIWPYPEFASNAWLAVPAVLSTISFQMTNSLLAGSGKFGMLSAVNGAVEIIRTMLSAVGLIAGFGVEGLLWSVTISRIAGIGATWITIPRQFGITLRHPEGAKIVRFGGWLYGCSIISVVALRTADAVLSSFVGPAALAVYSAAMQLPNTFQRMFESVRPVVLAYAASSERGRSDAVVTELRLVTSMLATAAILLIALSNELMILLYSAEYGTGGEILRMLAVWICVSIVNYYFVIAMTGFGLVRDAFLVIAAQAVVVVVASLICVPLLGGEGAALALVVTAAAGTYLACDVLAHKKGIALSELNGVLLRAIGPVIIMWVTTKILEDNIYTNLLIAIITISMLIKSGALRPSDMRQLLAALGYLWR